ncbi:MAG TPA: GntR family transcriptional regulator [Victivallales bacterium]|nr:GntR family transcriptional regulator [Victivallales bacterium]
MNSFIVPGEIREGSPFSKYYQIYLQLRKELMFGKHEKGSRFFSLRNLKEVYRVDMQTIRSAISLLVKDGLLTLRPASGIYVSNNANNCPRTDAGTVWFCVVESDIKYPFYHSILMEVQSQTSQFGMKTVYRSVSGLDEFSRWFYPEPGDGLILSGEIDNSFLKEIRKVKDLRYVVVGNYDLPKGVPCVASKVSEAVLESLKLSYAAGHYRFGIIINPVGKVVMRQIMDTVKRCDKDGLIKYVGGAFDVSEDGYLGMEKLKNLKIDSILVPEVPFFGLSRYVFEHGIKCPEDLFVIRLGKNSINTAYDDVAAVNLYSDKSEIARKALSALFWNGEALSSVSLDISVAK